MKKLLVILLVLAGLSAILFACGKTEPEEPTKPTEAQTTTGTTELWDNAAYEQWLQEQENPQKPPLTIEQNYYTKWDTRVPHLMAQDEENEAYLYGFSNTKAAGGSGAFLLYKESPCYLDWEYYHLHYSYPDMKVADFDGDGRQEIAFGIAVGGGTGVHPGRLTVVVPKPQRLKGFSDTDPLSWENYTHLGFDVYHFDPDDMRKQIDAVISVEDFRNEDGVFLRISDGKKTITGPPPMMATFEEHVRFSFEDGSIHMDAVAGSNWEVLADVEFKNGVFTLKNIVLQEF